MTPNPDAPSIEPKSSPKAKIDFNVSEEDLAKHKKQEEERKAKEASSPEDKDKDASSPDKDPAPVFAIGGGSDSEDD